MKPKRCCPNTISVAVNEVKYAEHYASGTNLVLLSPDVAEAFPNAEAVNNALRALVKIAHRNVAPIK